MVTAGDWKDNVARNLLGLMFFVGTLLMLISGMDVNEFAGDAGYAFWCIFRILITALIIPAMCPWIPRSTRKWLAASTSFCGVLCFLITIINLGFAHIPVIDFVFWCLGLVCVALMFMGKILQ